MTKKELELALRTERLANKLLLDKTAELEAKLKEKVMKIGPAQTLPAIHPSFPQYPYGQTIPCNPNTDFERWKPQITCQNNHLYRDNSGNLSGETKAGTGVVIGT